MIIIGLSGAARAGKDTVGQILVDQYGFTRLSFAAKLKEAVAILNPILTVEESQNAFEPWVGTQRAERHFVRVDGALDKHGYETAKDRYAEYRRLLQVMGTDVGREIFGENIWVDLVLKQMTDLDGKYVITDCRFPNEYQSIIDADGEVWRIQRPGYGPVNGHISETALNHIDFPVVINNDGTLDDLNDKVAKEWRVLA